MATKQQKVGSDNVRAKSDRKADIVFCIDATLSMDPCFDGIKDNLDVFLNGLGSHGAVDYRFKLLAYRDYHDPRCGVPWKESEFTDSASKFLELLNDIEPDGGGDIPESTLDALYLSIKSKWRSDSGLQRVVVLLTDSDSHPTISKKTYNLPDNTVERVIQEFQTLTHSMLFMIAPDFPVYQKINKSMSNADKKIFFKRLPVNEASSGISKKYEGLANVDFNKILKFISESISSSF